MTPERLAEIASHYGRLRIAVVGDFCLDRYLEIAADDHEISIETGLEVRNVLNVRSQPGAAGTIVNNLAALGVGEIIPVGFCGEDGEGFELRRALASVPGVRMDHFLSTPERRTFTYCKPLIVQEGQLPRELNRLDTKNWTRTPAGVTEQLRKATSAATRDVNAVIVMDQVPVAHTGMVGGGVLEVVAALSPKIPVIADSRRSLREFPPMIFKMNAAELSAMVDAASLLSTDEVREQTRRLAARNSRPVFVTLAELGVVGSADGLDSAHVPALPLRGPIDIVGAGDSVTANLAAALASGGTVREAMEFAMLASSIAIHQLGTTGSATVSQIAALHELALGGSLGR